VAHLGGPARLTPPLTWLTWLTWAGSPDPPAHVAHVAHLWAGRLA
jgi:hypothetical protein